MTERMAKLKSIHVYPIKSCRGLDLKSTRFDALGPLYDRRFMLVDADGAFLTQRALPAMAQIAVRLSPTALSIHASDMPVLKVPLKADSGRRTVEIWNDKGEAVDAGEEAASWFSRLLGRACRLVRLLDEVPRMVDPSYTQAPTPVGFADGFPVLLISQASLDDLNRRLGAAIPMNRFRPNLVVDGTEPYEEDTWQRIKIGDLELDVCKPCARCTVPSVDQLTGKRTGKEPLATLAQYRKRDGGAMFGQNCVHRSLGAIRVGDPVTIVSPG